MAAAWAGDNAGMAYAAWGAASVPTGRAGEDWFDKLSRDDTRADLARMSSQALSTPCDAA